MRLSRLSFFLLLAAGHLPAAGESFSLRSPGGGVEVVVRLTGEGGLRYRVSDRGRTVIGE
ncbi:MAG: hypothetical protein JNN01_00380, partial [Opitutaceae bacterium]|nr:hypothetical protein [Opitutaceae bacterium]